MAKTPCAIFWDIQNVAVPRGQSATEIVKLIRSQITDLYNLREIYFYCVCDVTKLSPIVCLPLTKAEVTLIQVYDYTRDSADIKLLDLMRKFVQNQTQECAIILLSGDGDYAVTLSDLRKLFNTTIFLIRLENGFSSRLQAVSHFTFVLTNQAKLYPVRSCGRPKYLVAFSRFPMTRSINSVKFELNKLTQPFGSIDRSAIDHENEVIIGFPTKALARKAVEQLDTARFHGTFLKAELLSNPSNEIMNQIRSACASVQNNRVRRTSSLGRFGNNSRRKESSEMYSPPRRLKETEDFIPLYSSHSDLSRDELTHNKSNRKKALRPSSTATNLKITSEMNGNRWVSMYSQRPSLKPPLLIDLTQAPSPIRNRHNSQPSPSKDIPMVDLTDEDVLMN